MIHQEIELIDVDDQARHLALELELAALEKGELNKPGEAVERLSQVLQRFDLSIEAMQMLETFLDDTVHGPEAAQVLRPFYQQQQEWSSYVICLEVILRDSIRLMFASHMPRLDDWIKRLTACWQATLRIGRSSGDNGLVRADIAQLESLRGRLALGQNRARNLGIDIVALQQNVAEKRKRKRQSR